MKLDRFESPRILIGQDEVGELIIFHLRQYGLEETEENRENVRLQILNSYNIKDGT